MCRSNGSARFVLVLALFCIGTPAVFAFDVPKPKKEKKKKDDAPDSDSNASKPADSKPADSKPAQKQPDQEAPQSAAAPAANPTPAAATVFEMKLPKSMWEKSFIKD